MRLRASVETFVTLISTGAWLGDITLLLDIVDENLLHLLAAHTHGEFGILLTAVIAKCVTQIIAGRIDGSALGFRIVLKSLGRMMERPAIAGILVHAERLGLIVRDLLVHILGSRESFRLRE